MHLCGGNNTRKPDYSDDTQARMEDSSQIAQESRSEAYPISHRAAVKFNPYTLRFVDKHIEKAYEACVTRQLSRLDLSGAVLLFGMSLVGAAYTWKYDVLDCFWGIGVVAVAATSLQLLLIAWAVHICPPRNPQLRHWVVMAGRIMDAVLIVALPCKTFWGLGLQRYLQSLLWDSGALVLVISAAVKPLPFGHLVITQLTAWLVFAVTAVKPLCLKYTSNPFYSPSVRQTYWFLMPFGLGVGASDSGCKGPLHTCCCATVVLMVSFLVGFVLPVCICHAVDYANRRAFAASVADALQVQPWPWAAEACMAVIAHHLAWAMLQLLMTEDGGCVTL